MIEVRRSTVINAPIAQVWKILRDFNGHDQWHPAVERSSVDDGLKTDQVGAVRNFTLVGGERLREQLLAMSDQEHRLRYSIIESDVPLIDYSAEISLKPVTDSNRTFWSWCSCFQTPEGREIELAKLVAEGVYETGFEAIRRRVETNQARHATHLTAPANDRAIQGYAMVIDRYGRAEELHQVAIRAAPPGPGQVRLRQTAIGVNYIDIYHRTGYFNLSTHQSALGLEAAGEVIDVGPEVRHLSAGQRVAYACPPVGAYATVRTMEAALVIALPDNIDDVTAAAGLLKGMTAEFLLHRVHALQRGETALIYAPAGGVGRLLCQWASALGATVIAATSSEQKARVARAAGARHVLLPGETSLEEQVLAITQGHGVDVVYDGVGRDSYIHSLAALKPCGHLVSFGQASGGIGSRDIDSLADKSVTLSRPNYAQYTDTPEKIAILSERLFDAIARRTVTIEAGQRFPLVEAAAAHRALESRQTTASIVLLPN